MINKDYLIEEVAKKHKIILSHDDPIFINLYLNDVVLRSYTSSLSEQMQSALETIDQINRKHHDNLQVETKAITQQITQSVSSELKILSESMRKEFSKRISIELEKHHQTTVIGNKTKRLLIALNLITIAACIGSIVSIFFS